MNLFRDVFPFIGSALILISNVFPAYGGEVKLDGYNDYVQVPDSPSLNISGSSLTMEAKIKLSGPSGNHWVICKQQINKSRSYGFYISNGNRQVVPSIETSGGFFEMPVGSMVLEEGTEYHISVVYNGSFITTYVDGSFNGSIPHTGNLELNNLDLYLGGTWWNPNDTINGSISEVRIWNLALSEAQINARLYDMSGDKSGLVGYWTFDSQEDLGVNSDGPDDYRDYSSNGNHGDLNQIQLYRLAYTQVQNLIRENGDNNNRLYFEVTHTYGQYVLDENVVLDAVLYDPNGDVVNVGVLQFSAAPIMLGSYEGSNGRVNYYNFFTLSSFKREIFDPLITGQYRLVVTTSEGLLVNFYHFNRIYNLPIISSKTFEFQTDSDNNVLWKWKIPNEAFKLYQTTQTSARAGIEIYDGDAYAGLVWITVPTHLEHLFIPAYIADQINSMGDSFKFFTQIRTNDNNNRSYSNHLELQDVHADIHHPSSDYDWDCDVDADDLYQFSLDFGLSNTCQVSD